jgi:RNA polymerase sigma-70 factor, ECF subfamily
MTLSREASLTMAGADARGRLLSELAAGPARKGYAIAYDMLGTRAEAEEAVQEALARACERLDDLRDPAAAPAWFLRIVATTCLRTLRRRRLKRAVFGRWFERASSSGEGDSAGGESDESSPSSHVDDADGPPLHGTRAPTAAAKLSDREEVHALLKHLDVLPAKQRAALVLRYGHDMPVPEVAATLGVELATAKTHLVRGLARLRDLMEEHR